MKIFSRPIDHLKIFSQNLTYSQHTYDKPSAPDWRSFTSCAHNTIYLNWHPDWHSFAMRAYQKDGHV